MRNKRIEHADARVRPDATGEVTISLHIGTLKEGGPVVRNPAVPGLAVAGRSITETVEITQGLARKIAESCLEHGAPRAATFARDSRPPLDLRIPVGVR